MRVVCGKLGLPALVAIAASLALPWTARATYPGLSGQIAFESFAGATGTGGAPFTEADTIESRAQTFIRCVTPQTGGALPCDFGAPSFSQDGNRFVVSRQIPADPLRGSGDQGQLEIVQSVSGATQTLPRQTADDRDPAFLPAGRTIVFDGRTSTTAEPNLYTVNTDGTRLTRLTGNGAANPAPCQNGTVAYVHRGDIYLLSGSRHSNKRLTFRGGATPSCSPNSKTVAFTRRGALYTLGANGKFLVKLRGGPLADPSFSPDGGQIAYVFSRNAPSQNGTQTVLRVVNLKGGQTQPDTIVANSSSSANSGVTATGSSDGVGWQPVVHSPLTVPELVHGTPISTKTGGPILSVALTSAGRLVAAVNGSGSVNTFNIRFSSADGSVRSVTRGATQPVPSATTATFAPAGTLLAVGQSSGQLTMLDVNRHSGAMRPAPGAPYPVPGSVLSVAIDPQGRYLAAATSSGSVAVFAIDPTTGALAPVPGSPYTASPAGAANSVSFDFDGSTLAVSNQQGQVALFSVDPGTGALAPSSSFAVRTPIHDVTFAGFGGLLLVDPPSPAPTIFARDPTGAVDPVQGSPFFGVDQFQAQTISPDGQFAAMIVPRTGVVLAPLISPDGGLRVPSQATPTGRGTLPQALAFSADDRLLATGNGGTVSLFRLTARNAPVATTASVTAAGRRRPTRNPRK
jgi:WD40 repeat protein